MERLTDSPSPSALHPRVGSPQVIDSTIDSLPGAPLGLRSNVCDEVRDKVLTFSTQDSDEGRPHFRYVARAICVRIVVCVKHFQSFDRAKGVNARINDISINTTFRRVALIPGRIKAERASNLGEDVRQFNYMLIVDWSPVCTVIRGAQKERKLVGEVEPAFYRWLWRNRPNVLQGLLVRGAVFLDFK